ncbi:Na+/H+ antiporter NhaA [Rhizobiaceae bacterium n13]|uniref:Na+/H+ antiporter NhaA n=1 Tax=Ferirhizobium litorale TaxID=2927786 RepID=UPI0024B2F382|nr:Na+/H+ antiporter NhaA [Fererhizobium litorale]MDI7862842.1 Na+/H+ antiporter NhaA [Fererhizobium litorale]
MTRIEPPSKLDRPVDETFDHILGNPAAEITLVEYGSYICPHCRAANEEIARVRDHFGERLRYIFRHLPIPGSEIARRAAELAECTHTDEDFWRVHMKLMTRSAQLTEEDIAVVTAELGLDTERTRMSETMIERAKARIDLDIGSARASGVRFTPTFFINDRRYDGPWDKSSLSDALLGRLGHRVQSAALDFAGWGPSAGLLLLLATILAVVLSNSPVGPTFEALVHENLGFVIGSAVFQLSLLHWINDGLLTIFFLVVGLEIKREMTVGRLATLNTAALPIAAAIGGMVVPALLYWLIVPSGPWAHGWGVPMATDTAFAVALIVMLGRRVPVELRVFLTAAAIVDDIGSIAVVAVFYSSEINLVYAAAAGAFTLLLWLLNRAHVYRVSTYLLLGIALWACICGSGFHASMAGIVLALFIPTRPPANLRALMVQADMIIAVEARQGDALRHGPSLPALRALDAIHDRIESPADRLLRHAGTRSSYLILPLFALANAGVEIAPGLWSGHEPLMLAIIAGLFVGKPLGMMAACAIAVHIGVASKPSMYSWQQLVGAAALAGIGFTMSLFIAGQAFAEAPDFAAAKIAVFLASILSAALGTFLLLTSRSPSKDRETTSLDKREAETGRHRSTLSANYRA